MKKCPTCDKTFPDSMRFCQTDGTVLVEDAPADPYKTVVGNQSDIAAAIPPVDPFKTMVASPPPKPEDDLLQLPPEQPDAMKTMVVPQDDLKGESKAGDILGLDSPPPSPFGGVPIIEPKAGTPSDFSSAPSPFGDSGKDASQPKSSEQGTSDATAVMDSSSAPEVPAAPPLDSKPFQNDFSGQSPYGNTDNLPIPSPFQGSMVGYQPPTGSPFDEPPTIRQSEPVFGGQSPSPSNTPFAEPPPQSPFGQAEPVNQPFQQNEWTPPPAPVSEWQNQNIGQNTPFQPPVAGQGLNQTLPIISLVLGIVSVCCYISPLTGLGALITGYLGMKNVNQDPNQYGGKGLAIAGMIVGGIFFLIGIVYWIYIIFIIGLAASGGFR